MNIISAFISIKTQVTLCFKFVSESFVFESQPQAWKPASPTVLAQRSVNYPFYAYSIGPFSLFLRNVLPLHRLWQQYFAFVTNLRFRWQHPYQHCVISWILTRRENSNLYEVKKKHTHTHNKYHLTQLPAFKFLWMEGKQELNTL